MILEKGDPDNLLGNIWMYHPLRDIYLARYCTVHPETILWELEKLVGTDTASDVAEHSDPGMHTLSGEGIYLESLHIDKGSISALISSSQDVMDLRQLDGSSVEHKMKEMIFDYFSTYESQTKDNPGKAYDSSFFCNEIYEYFRGAVEEQDPYMKNEFSRRLLAYSGRKDYAKDIKGMLAVSDHRSLKPVEKLRGIDLYAGLIDSYMKESYREAEEFKRQLRGWKHDNNID